MGFTEGDTYCLADLADRVEALAKAWLEREVAYYDALAAEKEMEPGKMLELPPEKFINPFNGEVLES